MNIYTIVAKSVFIILYICMTPWPKIMSAKFEVSLRYHK